MAKPHTTYVEQVLRRPRMTASMTRKHNQAQGYCCSVRSRQRVHVRVQKPRLLRLAAGAPQKNKATPDRLCYCRLQHRFWLTLAPYLLSKTERRLGRPADASGILLVVLLADGEAAAMLGLGCLQLSMHASHLSHPLAAVNFQHTDSE